MLVKEKQCKLRQFTDLKIFCTSPIRFLLTKYRSEVDQFLPPEMFITTSRPTQELSPVLGKWLVAPGVVNAGSIHDARQ